MMYRFFILFYLFFGLTTSNAQIHEVGVFLGGSNYIGEIGPTTYIAPNEPAFGFLYKWNKSPRHSWRASFTHAKISATDADSDMTSRVERDYSFANTINEISLGLEFNFFDFNLHNSKTKFTPYIYVGIDLLNYKGLYFVNDVAKSSSTYNSIAIPVAVGLKYRIAQHLILGFEIRPNYSFADDIDGSNPKDENLNYLKFGNINSNDWYVFTGFTLTYTFGNKPCYCSE